MEPKENKTPSVPYETLKQDFLNEARGRFQALDSEIAKRNEDIVERDGYIYGDLLERNINVPIGHDKTEVNWLRRTVEIHKNMFMSRGFQVISTYDTTDTDTVDDDKEKERLSIENKKKKAYAEERKRVIDAIIEDNGGADLFSTLAENASAIGTAGLKAYYDDDKEKYVLSEIEAIENIYVLWNRDNYRGYDAVAFAHQVSKSVAVNDYGAPQDVATSPMGRPLEVLGSTATSAPATYSNQPMVTILELTGIIEGWASEKGRLKRVKAGDETPMNIKAIGNKITRLIDDPKKLPKYYLFPNKRQRRRPWGISDISDAAININATYIETLSDWRTVAAKVNFPKYKAYGFGNDTQLPKSEPRKVQAIPLAEGQDMVPLDQGDANQIDFRAQMDELKEQFVRETGISRVLFDDPSVTLNSNQALLTSMKPTSDIAEAKKQLWAPILIQLFQDALETLALWKDEFKELAGDDFTLKVMWPSLMQKEDPVYQQMLLNRKNAGVISVQSYLEAQGESKEELDRIKEEMKDPITAAIHGNMLNMVAEQLIAPPTNENPAPKTTISLRGDLTPQQEANLATQQGFNDGPFPPSMGPQGQQGRVAQENQDNEGFLTDDAFAGGKPITRGPDGQPVGMQKSDKADGSQPNAQMTTPANNQPGQGVASQPGSGATTTSAQGALNQTNQNNGA